MHHPDTTACGAQFTMSDKPNRKATGSMAAKTRVTPPVASAIASIISPIRCPLRFISQPITPLSNMIGKLSGITAKAKIAPEALTHIHALLKPGGLLISKIPCVGDMGFALRLGIPVMHAIGKAPFVNFFGKEKLKNLIRDADFEIEESGLHADRGHNLFVVASSK
jgi:hypothetical protein